MVSCLGAGPKTKVISESLGHKQDVRVMISTLNSVRTSVHIIERTSDACLTFLTSIIMKPGKQTPK